MAVSNQTIIDKMIKELNQAKESKGQQWHRNIANVQMLCELLLESEGTEQEKQVKETVSGNSVSTEELTVMMGERAAKEETPNLHKQRKIDDPEANGDSIFDF